MYRIALKTTCIVAVSLALVSQSKAAPINQNLLNNPGFESGTLNGWNIVGAIAIGASSPSAHEGDYYLKSTGKASSTAIQTVDLEALGFDAHRLATGGYEAVYEGYIYCVNTANVGSIHLQEFKSNGSSNGTTSLASSNAVGWHSTANSAGLTPGTTKLSYIYTARNLIPNAVTQAHLDDAGLQIREYYIWTHGDVSTAIHTSGHANNGAFNIGSSSSGQINITHNTNWTTTGNVSVGKNYSSSGKVNIESGTWDARDNVNLGALGNATVNIKNNGTWKVTGNVTMGSDNGNDKVNVNHGLWETSGKVQIGELGDNCKVNIGDRGKWISRGAVRTNDVDSYNRHAEITVNGGQWEARGKNYIGLTADSDDNNPVSASTITVKNSGQWTTTNETNLGHTARGKAEVILDNGTWTSSNQTYVGQAGTASVDIKNGGEWTSNHSVSLGQSAGASGTVTLSSASTWTANDTVNDNLKIGYEGTGEVTINNNATFETKAGLVYIGQKTGSEGTVNIDGGTWNDTSNAVFVGDFGAGTVNITGGGTWNSNYTSLGHDWGGPGGTVNLTNGSWNANGDTIVGMNSESELNIGDNGTWTTKASAGVGNTNKGTVDINGGTWNAQGRSAIGTDYADGELVIQNNGRVNATGEFTVYKQGIIRLESGTIHLAGDWENKGKIKQSGGHLFIEHSGVLGNMELNGGKVSILGNSTVADAGGITVGSGSTMILDQGGTVSIGSGKSLHINNLLQMPNGDGTIKLNNGLLTHAQKRLNLSGGSIEGRGQIFVGNKGLHLGTDGTLAGTAVNQRLTVWGHVSGSGTLDNVTLYGNLNVGNSPGIIEADGLSLTSATTLEMELGGLLAGTEYDQLILDGLLTLDGTLDVTWYDNFEAILGDSFTLFALEDGASIEGQFNEIRLPTFSDPSLSWDTSGLYTAGTISVVPEPSTLALLLAGGLAMIRRRM